MPLDVRARRGAVVAGLLLLGGCTAGDRTAFPPPATSSTTSSTLPSTVATTAATTTSTTAATADPAGSVTLRVSAFTLPDARAGGTGLRLLLRSSSPRLTVRRRGGAGAVSACPVANATAPVVAAECLDLRPSGTVELGGAEGIELRAAGPEASVDEATVTYLPATRSTTIVTPARPAGACAPRPCDATYSLVPGRAGAFVLDGRATGGRPSLVLTAVASNGAAGSNRTLATVQGGGILSIRATLDAVSEASLLHHEQGPDPVSPVTAEILWP